MKKVFFLVALSVLVSTSCQKSESISSSEDVLGCEYQNGVIDGSAHSNIKPGLDVKYLGHYYEGGTDYGQGIKINGVLWAPVNCGIGEDYAYPYGLLYQWGRSDGQAYDGESGAPSGGNLVNGQTVAPEAEKFYYGYSEWFNGTPFTDWSMNNPSGGIGNPCPTGWRLPTYDEWCDLKAIVPGLPGFTPSVVTKTIGTTTVYGSYFDGTSNPGTGTGSVFLPAAGSRSWEGITGERDSFGHYWADSRPSSSEKPFEALFSSFFNEMTNSSSASYGFSVRCVRTI